MRLTASERLSIDLAARFVRLEPLLAENLDDTGHVLNYLFLADVARWMAQAVRDPTLRPGDVTQLLDFLESSFSEGSFEVRNLISIGFVQMLPSTGEPGAELRNMLGPLLAAEYKDVNW